MSTSLPELQEAREAIGPRKIAGYVAGLVVFLGLCVFWPAGTLDWPRGWLFAGVLTACSVVISVFLWRVNPEIFAARSRFRAGTKRWDAILLVFLLTTMTVEFIVAALDDARYGWLPTPNWVVALGYVLCLIGFAGMTWAEAVNKFFEPSVRIQTDRGQHVIDTGPYRFVRHPGYVSALFLLGGIALALGSVWALVPAAIAAALLLLRTHWEDQTLRAELPGYDEYSRRVRFRLLPGVW